MLRKGQTEAVKRLSNISDIKGKKVLEIGGDLKHETADYLIDQGASHVTSINIDPKITTQKINDQLDVVNLDATKLLSYFEEETFDLAFGVAILEHIHNTKLLLDEVHSVLKPNGTALLHAGPVWTSAIGHHTWVECDQTKYRFNDQSNPIPDWHHLLFDLEEMVDFLVSKKGMVREHATSVANYIYEDGDLSRMGYMDYINAFKDSEFRTIMIYEEAGKPIPEYVGKKLKKTQYENQKEFEVVALQFIVEK